MAKKIKILIAIDGSKSAMAAVRYAGNFFNPQKTDVVLIHIMSNMPPAAEVLRSVASPEDTNVETEKWHRETTKHIQKKMEEAESILQSAGYDKQSINVKIQTQIKGVARDIIAESEKAYNALLVGRRGLNDPTNNIVGATAYRMMKAIEHLPVVIVGDNPDSGNVLIGFDGSENSLKAVDCVCELMPHPLRKVVLCHVSRETDHDDPDGKALARDQKKEGMNQGRNPVETVMQRAEDRLAGAGFDRSLIEKEILEGMISRAVAISKTAESRHCGSVVVGRRGLSIIRDFMMGRVTMKILHKAHTQAVWIV
ncbi:MAG: universal stress protein [Desulfobacteraceae bacterium]|nr:universal stress protein [Desulfobacteraceae bacterium]MBC2755882.1 universal stress protein [Desulfobacteraceae bacterium]